MLLMCKSPLLHLLFFPSVKLLSIKRNVFCSCFTLTKIQDMDAVLGGISNAGRYIIPNVLSLELNIDKVLSLHE